MNSCPLIISTSIYNRAYWFMSVGDRAGPGGFSTGVSEERTDGCPNIHTV